MNSDDLKTRVNNINDRTTRMEQILPTLATKEDLRQEGELTRAHFDAVAERIEESVKLIAEGHVGLDQRVTRLERIAKLR